MSEQDIVEMKAVELPSAHPLTSPGMRSIHDNSSARHLAVVADIIGSVFNHKIRAIQRKLIAGEYVDGIELHQFVMHAELVLSEEDIIMADTLLAALGVGPSGDVPVVGAGFVTEEAFDKLKQNPRFEARVNPDDDDQVGILHLDNGKFVNIKRRPSDIVPTAPDTFGLLGAPRVFSHPVVPGTGEWVSEPSATDPVDVSNEQAEIPFSDELKELLSKPVEHAEKLDNYARDAQDVSDMTGDLPPGINEGTSDERMTMEGEECDREADEQLLDVESDAVTGEGIKGAVTSECVESARLKSMEAEQELSVVESEMNAEEMRRSQAENELKVMEDAVRQSEQQRIDTEQEILRLEGLKKAEQLKLIEIEKEKKRLDEVKRDADQKFSESDAERTRIEDELKDTRVKIATAESDKKRLEAAKQDAESKLAEITVEKARIEIENEEAVKRLNEFEIEIQRIEASSKESQKRLQECETALKKSIEKKQEIEGKLKDAENEKKMILQQSADIDGKIQDCSLRSNQMEEDIVSADKKLKAYEADVITLQASKKEVENKLHDAIQKKKRVEEDRRQKYKKLDEVEKERKRIAEENRTAELKRLELEKELMREEEAQRLAELKQLEKPPPNQALDSSTRKPLEKGGETGDAVHMDSVEQEQYNELTKLQQELKDEEALAEEQERKRQDELRERERVAREERIASTKRKIEACQQQLQDRKRRRLSNEPSSAKFMTSISPSQVVSNVAATQSGAASLEGGSNANLVMRNTANVHQGQGSGTIDSLDDIFGIGSSSDKAGETLSEGQTFEGLRARAAAKSKLMKELDSILALKVVEQNKTKIKANMDKEGVVIPATKDTVKSDGNSFFNIIGGVIPSLESESYENRVVKVREMIVTFVTENYGKFTQDWLKKYCTDRKTDVLSWINDVQKGNVVIDGGMVVCTAACISRNIKIISAGKRWASDTKGTNDLYLCYAGDKEGAKIFLPAEVESITGFDDIYNSIIGKTVSQLDEVFVMKHDDDPNYDDDTEGYTSASSLSGNRTTSSTPKATQPSKRKRNQGSKLKRPIQPAKASGKLTDLKIKKPKSDTVSTKDMVPVKLEDETSAVSTRRRSSVQKRSAKSSVARDPSSDTSGNDDNTGAAASDVKDTDSVQQVNANSPKVFKAKVVLKQMHPSQSEAKVKESKDKPASSSEAKDTKRSDYKIKCETCGELFDNERKLTVHHATHSAQLKCFICSETYENRRELTRHLTSKHDKPYLCYIGDCLHACQTTNGLKIHMKHIHREAPEYCCPKCNKGLKTEKAKDNHVLVCKGIKKGEQCFHCFQIIADRETLKRHLASQHNITLIVCQRCHSEFAGADDLQQHTSENPCSDIVRKRKEKFDEENN